jgi:hypothetical protein
MRKLRRTRVALSFSTKEGFRGQWGGIDGGYGSCGFVMLLNDTYFVEERWRWMIPMHLVYVFFFVDMNEVYWDGWYESLKSLRV